MARGHSDSRIDPYQRALVGACLASLAWGAPRHRSRAAHNAVEVTIALPRWNRITFPKGRLHAVSSQSVRGSKVLIK